MSQTREKAQIPSTQLSHSADHTAQQVHHHHSHAAASRHDQGHHLLQVSHLSVGFKMYDSAAPFFQARQSTVRVVDDLSISVHAGEIVAVVGASGSGKTILADCVMGLFEPNSHVEGEIWFDGTLMDADALADVRGREGGIALVPQGVAHLDPLMRVGRQVEGFSAMREARSGAGGSAQVKAGKDSSGGTTGATKGPASARDREGADSRLENADETASSRRKRLFERYGLSEDVARMYPFELSGGMARRVLLCCALMGNPKVIIADEPTPGLDLELAVAAMADFRAFADEGGGVMLITHDIELALEVADRVAVFKDGAVVEETAVENFSSPDLLEHPFSKALWHALPEHGFEAMSPACVDEPHRT